MPGGRKLRTRQTRARASCNWVNRNNAYNACVRVCYTYDTNTDARHMMGGVHVQACLGIEGGVHAPNSAQYYADGWLWAACPMREQELLHESPSTRACSAASITAGMRACVRAWVTGRRGSRASYDCLIIERSGHNTISHTSGALDTRAAGTVCPGHQRLWLHADETSLGRPHKPLTPQQTRARGRTPRVLTMIASLERCQGRGNNFLTWGN
jgi:hypothetical protein